MHQLYTGYFIDEMGEIVDDNGPTRSYILDNQILWHNGVGTGYTVSGATIEKNGSPTGYVIIGGGIFGPFKYLPWLR